MTAKVQSGHECIRLAGGYGSTHSVHNPKFSQLYL